MDVQAHSNTMNIWQSILLHCDIATRRSSDEHTPSQY
jgi:hypothetical protein